MSQEKRVKVKLKIRSDRINNPSNNCYILSETKTQKYLSQIELLNPKLVIIDSISDPTYESYR